MHKVSVVGRSKAEAWGKSEEGAVKQQSASSAEPGTGAAEPGTGALPLSP